MAEHQAYEDFKKGVPRVGKAVSTPKGEGVILKHNPLAQTKLASSLTDEMPKPMLSPVKVVAYNAIGVPTSASLAKKQQLTARPSSHIIRT